MGDSHIPSSPQKKERKLINLLKGWPNPSLLPTAAIAKASQTVLSDLEIAIPGLCYGPDPGYQPLREEISKWLRAFYGDPTLDSLDSKSQRQISTTTTTGISNEESQHRENDQGNPQAEEIEKESKKIPQPPSTQKQLGSGQSTYVPSSNATLDPADRICITGGASQNLACILQVYSDPVKTRVWMVAPCYFLACRIFEDAGLRLRGVREVEVHGEGEGKEWGVDLEALEKGMKGAEVEDGREGVKPLKTAKPYSKIYPHIIYLVPTFSNPSGKTMSLLQRQKLVLLARKYDALIVTDDVYDFLQWPGGEGVDGKDEVKAPVMRLVDVDRTLEPVPGVDDFGNAVSNGSFSKIVGPGVRTGWAESTPKFTYGLSQCGSSRSGGAPSQLVATMMAELLKTGVLQNHIRETLIPAYEKKCGAMMEAIGRILVPKGVVVGDVAFGRKGIIGGYFIWLTLPVGMTAKIVVDRAMEEWNLVVSPGTAFEVSGDVEGAKFSDQLRLCFAWEEEADLIEGVERLGDVIDSIAKDGGRGSGSHFDGKGFVQAEKDLGAFQ